MRVWRLAHKDYGLLEVIEGQEDELRALDPEWESQEQSEPEDSEDSEDSEEPEDSEDSGADLEALAQRFEKWAKRLSWPFKRLSPKLVSLADRARANIGMKVLITADGKPIARVRRAQTGSISLPKPDEEWEYPPAGDFAVIRSGLLKPRLKFEASGLREVLAIYCETEDGIWAFPPPAGSFAAERAAAMDASPVKRLLFPIFAGLGKVGWALVALVVVPLVLRFFAWVLSPFAAFFSMIWQAISRAFHFIFDPIGRLLAAIFGPIWDAISRVFSAIFGFIGRILAPIGDFLVWLFTPLTRFLTWLRDQIPELPGWLDWLIEHPKLWVPIILGIVFGIGSYRRSKRAKRQQEQGDTEDS